MIVVVVGGVVGLGVVVVVDVAGVRAEGKSIGGPPNIPTPVPAGSMADPSTGVNVSTITVRDTKLGFVQFVLVNVLTAFLIAWK